MMKKLFSISLIIICLLATASGALQPSEFNRYIAYAENSDEKSDTASDEKTAKDDEDSEPESEAEKEDGDLETESKSKKKDEDGKTKSESERETEDGKSESDNKDKSKYTDNSDSENNSSKEKEDEKSNSMSDEKSDNESDSKNSSNDKDKDDADNDKNEDESDEEEEYVIHADKYLIFDLDYNTVLISKNSSKKINPAGLTKILTAITVIENIEDINKAVTVPQKILKDYDYYYGNVGLSSGDKTTYRNLLTLMMMRDAGDCAVALSHLCLDSYNDFILKMNETAKKAGAKNSYFDNPAGFTSSKTYSTLDDMNLIARYALKNEIFCEIASCSSLEIPSSEPEGNPKRYFNKNYFLSAFYSFDYYNENIKAGKEYYVSEDNTGLFVHYNNGYTNLLCLCAGSDTDDKKNYAYDDINSLITTAKTGFSTVSVIQQEEFVTEISLKNGANADRVLLVADEGIKTKLAIGYDPSKIDKEIKINEKIKAPIKKGEILGEITVSYNGSPIGNANLIAFSEVEGSFMKHFMYYFDLIVSSVWFKTSIVLLVAAIIGYAYVNYRKKNK